MFHFRLHAKFLGPILGSLVIFLGILSYVIIHREARLITRKGIEQQHILTQAIVTDLKESMLTGRPRSTLKLMKHFQSAYGLTRLEVLRRDGTPAFGIRHSAIGIPRLEQAFDAGREIAFQEHGALPLHTVLYPLKNEHECRGCHAGANNILGVIRISLSLEDTASEIAKNTMNLIVLLSVLILVIGGVMYGVVRNVVLKPLVTLHRGAKIIGMGDLSHRITLPTRDEFHDLANAFNEMADRLDETYAGFESMVRKRTAELSENVRLTEGILANMSSGVALLDMDGRVKLMNREGARILRCNHETIVGQRLADCILETAEFMEADTNAYQEIEIRMPDGASVPIGFSSACSLGAKGKPEGVIVVYRDLTEIKALQSELLTKERFAAMGRVVAGVAHEIRNPLFGISSIAQIFERDLKDPAYRELARALLSETWRLNQLVEELLIYGRPTKLTLGRCDLQRLWEEVFEMHREELELRGINITGDYGIRHPVAYLDAHQIRQVFLNLLRNSLDATPAGGEINVRLFIEDRYIIFKVSDTGVGIPAQSLDRVFDLFFTTKPKGTGLGLAICKKIVQDHGGEVMIESKERQGTTVTVKLPYRGIPEKHEIPISKS